MSWSDEAACKDHPLPGMWFASEEHPDTVEAVKVCADCPVRFDCLEHAIANRETDGVWGGYTARQRRRVARGNLPGRVNMSGPEVAPCGTKSARQRHRRWAEDCSTCGTSGGVPAACGDRAGFRRHRREGTEPCGLCLEAERAYRRERKRRWRAGESAA
jgi:WhiB family transcriptional regulator, redox-sensing transcriptional regulator